MCHFNEKPLQQNKGSRRQAVSGYFLMIIPSFRQSVGRNFQSCCHYVKSLSTARLTIDKVVFINWFLAGWRPSQRKIKVMLALIIVQQPLANSKSTRKPTLLYKSAAQIIKKHWWLECHQIYIASHWRRLCHFYTQTTLSIISPQEILGLLMFCLVRIQLLLATQWPGSNIKRFLSKFMKTFKTILQCYLIQINISGQFITIIGVTNAIFTPLFSSRLYSNTVQWKPSVLCSFYVQETFLLKNIEWIYFMFPNLFQSIPLWKG